MECRRSGLRSSLHVRIVRATSNGRSRFRYRANGYERRDPEKPLSPDGRSELRLSTACCLIVAFGLNPTLAVGAAAHPPVLSLTGYEATSRYTGVRFESREKDYWRTLI